MPFTPRHPFFLSLGTGTLFTLLLTLPFPAAATFTSFSQWCAQRQQVTPAQRHTIDALLKQAGTPDCQQAEQVLLSQAGLLDLGNQNITDLSPLASLTTISNLNLTGNQIQDISPLSNLQNLSFLLIAFNEIQDISPLANLKNLRYLVIENNQITDLSSLNSLPNLTALIAMGNPLTQKVCPITPATICIFDNPGEDLVAQADAYAEKGEFRQALTTLEEAKTLYQNQGDRLRLGDTLNRLGDLHANLSQYPQALSYYQQVLTLRRELQDLPGLGISLTSLATTYEKLGQYQKAEDIFKQALDNITAQEKSGNIPLEGGIYELPKDAARLQTRLALIYNKQGEHETALKSGETALKLYQQLPDDYLGKRQGESIALDTMGVTYFLMNQPQKALELLEQALIIAQEIGDRATEGRILNHIGEVQSSLKNYSQAISFYEKALNLRQQINDAAGMGTTLTNLGWALMRMNQLASASDKLLAAIKIWESLRPGLTDENQISLFETQLQTYQHLQTALIAQNQVEKALEIAERSRARAFVELLAARLNGQVGDDFMSNNPPSIAEIRQIVQQQQATLVQYSIVGNQVYIWVIQPTGVIDLRSIDLNEIDISLGEAAERSRLAASTGRIRGQDSANTGLGNWVRGTRTSVEGEAKSTPEIATDPTSELVRARNPLLWRGYQILIAPIADLLPANPEARIIFIPQGPLFSVPFPALQNDRGVYLIENHTILTAPAIQVLGLTHQHHRRLQSNPDNTALVVGNPTMPALPDNPSEPLDPLPGAEIEAQAIAKILETEPVIGAAATKPEIVRKMQSSRLIHLATHGLLNELKPLGWEVPGAMALAPTANSDGLLTSSEILDLRLQADLVVLSACNTGLGDITGDGVIGLSRSFIAAGTSSLIVSLWAVPDAPTAELMAEFYRQYQQTSDKAKALRQAMLITLQRYPVPRDWAAFTLIGEAE